MIVRLIIFIALVTLLIMVYRKISAPKQGGSSDASSGNGTASMRKCAQCGVHLPEAEACREEDKFFCSEEHRQAYLNNQADD